MNLGGNYHFFNNKSTVHTAPWATSTWEHVPAISAAKASQPIFWIPMSSYVITILLVTNAACVAWPSPPKPAWTTTSTFVDNSLQRWEPATSVKRPFRPEQSFKNISRRGDMGHPDYRVTNLQTFHPSTSLSTMPGQFRLHHYQPRTFLLFRLGTHLTTISPRLLPRLALVPTSQRRHQQADPHLPACPSLNHKQRGQQPQRAKPCHQ